eukprot:CAMPEP_0113268256 /NCGR_PEP_ID=MMETSP0008_2-20120614/21068_1 /TAXON_ID=97485 /ORGANISM="Prymnesium parvum" /LENGTH=166 /DNA_ID=CAMNT_0000117389 /DNA_START=135 /DNA_END=632 /DNA_ORIENTATION=- /assembly_acc=CAM_ASM_000153
MSSAEQPKEEQPNTSARRMGKAKMEQEHQPNDKEARTESTDEPMMENENDEEQASSKLSELYVSDDMAMYHPVPYGAFTANGHIAASRPSCSVSASRHLIYNIELIWGRGHAPRASSAPQSREEGRNGGGARAGGEKRRSFEFDFARFGSNQTFFGNFATISLYFA